HAFALGLQHHQSRSRPLPHLWLGTFPKTWGDRRGSRDLHRPQHRRALSVLSSPPWHGAHPHSPQPASYQPDRLAPPPARLSDRQPAICPPAHPLDPPPPHRPRLPLGSAPRPYDPHSHTHLRSAAQLGP